MTQTIDDKTGWFNATVLEVSKDKVKLYNENTGEKIWVDKNKLKVVPRKVMAYITLPSYSSRHMGHNYKGFCLEK
jgi:hypothetical protein